MIQINDYATPIEVAQKIISGTEEVETSMVDKAMMRTFGCKEVDTLHRDMLSIAEIKEIAGYLLVYCNTHKEGRTMSNELFEIFLDMLEEACYDMEQEGE